MRHRVAHRKLGRTSSHRIALLRNLCTSLLNSESGQIVTTLPKAKELRPFVERAITLGKHGTLHSRRLAAKFVIGGQSQQRIRSHKKVTPRVIESTAGVRALDRLFDSIGPRFADRPGGYTRIVKLGFRKGDGAPLAAIQLVDVQTSPASKEESKDDKKSKKAKGETETKAGKKKASAPAEGAPAKSTSKKTPKPKTEDKPAPKAASKGRKKKSEKSEE